MKPLFGLGEDVVFNLKTHRVVFKNILQLLRNASIRQFHRCRVFCCFSLVLFNGIVAGMGDRVESCGATASPSGRHS